MQNTCTAVLFPGLQVNELRQMLGEAGEIWRRPRAWQLQEGDGAMQFD